MNIRKIITFFALSACVAGIDAASIRFNVPQQLVGSGLAGYYMSLPEMAASKSLRDVKREAIESKIDKASFTLDLPVKEAARVNFAIGEGNDAVKDFLYIMPDDNLTVDIARKTDASPWKVKVTGNELMDGIASLNDRLAPVEERIMAARAGQASQEEVQALFKEYEETLKMFIADTKGTPASIFAIMNLDGKEYIEYFESLPESAKSTLLYPLAARQADIERASLRKQEMQDKMESDHVAAPDFTLPDLSGKMVSLKDFRGKWVILDFWGSWCGWCIKGMPGLKDAYKKYAPDLEIVGVDCGDTDQQWRDAVKRLELPWVHLYNAQGDNGVEKLYGVQGFPTKIIISPEGKIYKIVTGEDPEFYNYLSKALGR